MADQTRPAGEWQQVCLLASCPDSVRRYPAGPSGVDRTGFAMEASTPSGRYRSCALSAAPSGAPRPSAPNGHYTEKIVSNVNTLTEQAVMDGTCAVIVTYGNRLLFVEQVLRGAFVAGAGHGVLVDNGTEPAVAQALKSCTALWGTGRVTYIRLERNGGSAEGFAAGIAAAAQRPDTRHIWLLDDDTVADTSTLKALMQTWLLMGADPLCCLSSFRQDKRTYINLAERHKPNAIQENSFFGFSVQAPFQKKRFLSGRKRDWTVLVWKWGRMVACGFIKTGCRVSACRMHAFSLF